jgi:hypothetical protein
MTEAELKQPRTQALKEKQEQEDIAFDKAIQQARQTGIKIDPQKWNNAKLD